MWFVADDSGRKSPDPEYIFSKGEDFTQVTKWIPEGNEPMNESNYRVNQHAPRIVEKKKEEPSHSKLLSHPQMIGHHELQIFPAHIIHNSPFH